MPNHFQNMDLTGNSLDIIHILDLIFLKNFYCNTFICKVVNA